MNDAPRAQFDDRYVMESPRPQLAIDLFKGEWASRFPANLGLVGGAALLFEDPRVQWMIDQAGGLKSKSVLELGPLEAGHTYMFESVGASRIVSIEANYRAFLKCLVIKNLLNLRAQFLLGDFVKYLEEPGEQFDFLIASGVLYHMIDPLKLLYLISRRARQIGIWTHYYKQDTLEANPILKRKFPRETVESNEYGGFRATYHKQLYFEATSEAGFCGGSAPISYWLDRQTILDALKHYGYSRVATSLEEPDHPNGPSFTVFAEKSGV